MGTASRPDGRPGWPQATVERAGRGEDTGFRVVWPRPRWQPLQARAPPARRHRCCPARLRSVQAASRKPLEAKDGGGMVEDCGTATVMATGADIGFLLLLVSSPWDVHLLLHPTAREAFSCR